MAKKAARKGVALATWAGRRLWPATATGCRVLTYHRFADTPRDPFAVTPAAFRRQMRYLAERGLAVSLARIEDFVHHGRPLPRDAVLVAIDDGVASVYREALPVLRDLAVPAALYITPSLIGVGRAGRPAFDGPEPYLTWNEVGRLAAGGVTIGSHAWTHRSLGGRSDADVADEARRSREAIERHVGLPVTSFAYPFGTRADFDDRIAAILKASGYRTAFTSQHGPVRADSDPLLLPRVKVEGGEEQWLFRLLVAGGLDSWRLIDQTLWRLQARHG